jgi:hypothetical protein
MFAKLLLLYIDKWIFIFLFYNSGRRTMPGKDDKIVVEGIELLTDRCLNLLVASAFKIGTPDAAVKESITAEYTIGTADKADPTGCMARSV